MHCRALLVAATAAAACAPTSARSHVGPKLGGVNLVANGFESPAAYGGGECAASLTRARRDAGVAWVQLSFPWYQRDINSTGPIAPVVGGVPSGTALNNASSPTNAEVAAAIAQAHALNMSVILRPMVDLNWNYPDTRSFWRGDIGTHFNASQWDAWFATYTGFMTSFAQFAVENNVEAMCLGAELQATEKQNTLWRQLFASVRAIFPRMVYYSSTSGNADWWDASDFIGMDVYPSLATPNPNDPSSATVPQLVAAWNSTLEHLSGLATHYNRSVIIAETGICGINATGIYLNPSFYQCAPPFTPQIDVDVQTKYYDAFFQAAWGQPYIAGAFFWKWLTWSHDDDPGSPYNGNFSPSQHPASAIMAQYFGAASGHT